ncbi:MAG: PKD domain-containing protein [Myxococcota bacterium]
MRLYALFLALPGCADMKRLEFNQPPGPPVVAIEPAEPTTVDTLNAVLVEDATDPEGDALAYTYTWHRNGVAWTANALWVDPIVTEHGDLWELYATADDGEWESEPAIASVTIANTAPTVLSAAITPNAPRTADDLVLEVEGEDADEDTISWRTAWYRAGVEQTDLADLLTVPADRTGSLEEWSVRVTPWDGAVEGEPVELAVYVDNTAPSLATASIVPTDPQVLDSVLAGISGLSDPDGQTVTVDFTWYVNGALLRTDTGTAGTASLSGAFNKGDVLEVEAVASDGYLRSATVRSAPVTVVNTPPVVEEAVLDPLEGDETTTFTCTVVGEGDDDGDPVDVDYDWYVDGIRIAENGPTLDGADFRKDDEIYCVLTPNDGEEDGDPVTSESAWVENSAPSLSAVTLSPATVTESTGVSCAVSGGTDLDGDSISYTYRWYVDGTLAATGTSTSLSASNYERGDEIYVTATPTDGTDSGSAVASATITVENAAPRLSSATVTPAAPNTDSTLTVTPSGFTDPDDDAEGYAYQWYVDGAAVTGATTSTLGPEYTSPGDRVHCTVWPDDGYDLGSPVLSNTVTIVNRTPTASAALVGSSSVTECDTVQLDASGSTDTDGDVLDYLWTLASKPSASLRTSDDIDATTDEMPWFVVDAAGTFVFQVRVSDSQASDTRTVSVEVAERADNVDPVAVAGDDQFSSGYGTCRDNGYTYVCDTCTGDSFTLDASGSTDSDGDVLSYVWSTSSTYASIADSSAETTTMTLSSLPASYGSSTAYDVSVRLRVVDCAGGVSEDYLTVTFECTGI